MEARGPPGLAVGERGGRVVLLRRDGPLAAQLHVLVEVGDLRRQAVDHRIERGAVGGGRLLQPAPLGTPAEQERPAAPDDDEAADDGEAHEAVAVSRPVAVGRAAGHRAAGLLGEPLGDRDGALDRVVLQRVPLLLERGLLGRGRKRGVDAQVARRQNQDRPLGADRLAGPSARRRPGRPALAARRTWSGSRPAQLRGGVLEGGAVVVADLRAALDGDVRLLQRGGIDLPQRGAGEREDRGEGEDDDRQAA